MPIVLLLIALGVVYAFSRWYEDKREQDAADRMEKLRQRYPDAAVAAASVAVDGMIEQRKRETETLREVNKHPGDPNKRLF